MVIACAGSIDERGLINGLDRQGHTTAACIAEVLGNSIDSHARNIKIKISNDRTSIIVSDDGFGMTIEKLPDMVNLYKSNHSNDNSIGCFGTGFTTSAFQLSKVDGCDEHKPVTVYSKNRLGTYLKLVCPMDEIVRDGIISGKSKIEDMNDDEISMFNDEIKDLGCRTNCTGTLIHLPYTERLRNELHKQFKPKQATKDLSDCCSVIFGEYGVNISLYKGDMTQEVNLHKYDYFGCPDYMYYLGKQEFIILHFDERFIVENPENTGNGQYLEFKTSQKNTQKTPSITEVTQEEKDKALSIILTCAWRKDPSHFDVENPKMLESADYNPSSYDKDFFESKTADTQTFCSEIPIYRNGLHITRFNAYETNTGNARGNSESREKYSYHKGKISYETESTQTNILDTTFGIQQNKHQNQKKFPLSLTRLIALLKNWHFKQIKKYMEEECKKKNAKKEKKIGKNQIKKKIPKNFKVVDDQQTIDVEQSVIENIVIDDSNDLGGDLSDAPKEKISSTVQETQEEEILVQSQVQPILQPELIIVDNTIVDDSMIVKDNSTNHMEKSRKCYIEAAHMLMDYAAKDTFNLLNGEDILEIIRSHLKNE